MTFKSWWLYLLFLLLCLMIAGLAAGGYFLYIQQDTIKTISEQTRLMNLRVERLETLAQKEETRQALASGNTRKLVQTQRAPSARKPLATAPSNTLKPGKQTPQSTEKEAPEVDILQVRPEMVQAAPQTASPKPVPKKAGPAPAAESKPEKKPENSSELQEEPHTSDRVAIRNLRYARRGKRLIIRFRVANARKPNDPAIGYATVVLRGKRANKVWVEAWPPMRLSPLGRPVNYRRGTPFSVQHYRKVAARIRLDDKKFDRMEIVVYSRNGKLLLVHVVDLKLK